MKRFLQLLVSEPEENRTLLLCALLAFIAGLGKAGIRRAKCLQALASAAVAMIAGVAVGLIVQHMSGDRHFVMASAALGGWMGSAVLDFAGEKALHIIKSRKDQL